MIWPSPALEHFNDHGHSEEFAEVLGLSYDDGHLTFPYEDGDGPYRRRRNLLTGKTRQPPGRSVSPWTPVPIDGYLLICEGESDTQSAIEAMYGIVDVSEEDDDPEFELARRLDLPPPLQGAVPVGLPGANSCHQAIVDLAVENGADVVIALDGDEAGRTNAAKLAEKLTSKGVSVSVVDLPDGKDLSDVLGVTLDSEDILAELVSEAQDFDANASIGNDHPDPPSVEPLRPDIIGGLLEQTTELFDRYIVLPGDEERIALALFVAHSYAIDGAHATPYMLVVSPEKRSGKSRLLQVLELAVAKPWGVIGASEAAMFRKIGKDRPTLLLDEIDAIWGSYAERTEPLGRSSTPATDPAPRLPAASARTRTSKTSRSSAPRCWPGSTAPAYPTRSATGR